jgi:glycosyltransferase involved in cell wall biosynthesis
MLAGGLGVTRVEFCGPVYGDAKLALYQSACVHILPSHSENFGMTVAEALAAGIPAIATKGTPWEGLVREGAGWWIEIGVRPLVSVLESVLALSTNQLQSMGKAGREWMQREFSWDHIAMQMAEFYRWLLERCERPACVRLS